MSLLKSDERHAREASQWIEDVDFFKEKEKQENRDEKKTVKERGSARGSAEEKSQSRIKGTNKIRGERKLTRGTRRVDSLARESANVPWKWAIVCGPGSYNANNNTQSSSWRLTFALPRHCWTSLRRHSEITESLRVPLHRTSVHVNACPMIFFVLRNRSKRGGICRIESQVARPTTQGRKRLEPQ